MKLKKLALAVSVTWTVSGPFATNLGLERLALEPSKMVKGVPVRALKIPVTDQPSNKALRHTARVPGKRYLPDQAADKAMPDVVVRRAKVKTRIVRIGQPQIVVKRSFAESGTKVVLRRGKCVMDRELHAGVAEVVSIKRHNQGVVT